MSISILDWPGKSDKEGNEYPAVLHMLDVAACAERIIEGHPTFVKICVAQRTALIVLIALHDVGKISESFRDLIRNKQHGAPLHWELSDFLLCGDLDKIISDHLGSNKMVRAELYAAVAGHHGQPPSRFGGNRFKKLKRKRAVGSGSQAAYEWTVQLFELFPGASLGGMTIDTAKSLSWALSGLTVVADWVGSNTNWFPFKPCIRDLSAALQQSRERAKFAILNAGLSSAKTAAGDSDKLIGINELRPMQQMALNADLTEGPQLAVIEDATGSGKTEAALILSHRMIHDGKARGLFFALPTMATSDSMFERLQRVAPALFSTIPSVILTHSRASLNEAMRTLRGAGSDETPETDGADWLTDNRRRSLLATIGVGTIDQALLGILPTRFSTLRLFGLADKILIIDEAHSYDPYMQRELETLLELHARLGGSAILMTATLPLHMREAYVSAFQKGLEADGDIHSVSYYPGFHLIGQQLRSEAVPATHYRTVPITRITTQEDAIERITAAAAEGAACIWVRNAVDSAIEAVKELRRRGVDADLLHARFTMIDRLLHETTLRDRFGKNGVGREGRVLVATQVVEASLDLDFDMMISDLAPIGSLIQRAGRLWRHMDVRPKNQRPVQNIELCVLSPDPNQVDSERWLQETLGPGSFVYRLDDQWRTARALFDAGAIIEPDGLRSLIEAVHGRDAPVVPHILSEAENRAEGKALAERANAKLNVVETKNGYLAGLMGPPGNDTTFPTRLGVLQTPLVLARQENNRLIPWAMHDSETLAWALSEVSVAKHRINGLWPDQDAPNIKLIKNEWPKWRRESHLIFTVEETGEISDGVRYDRNYGLQISKDRTRSSQM